ncbi:MAG TPA: DUF4276 family protein [Thermoanaerobaculia bacterium]|nr:DUF4276 family protein [Thermoanaerobaculia bacterium]
MAVRVPDELPRALTQPGGREAFAAICAGAGTPEDINEGATTAPSKRLKSIFPTYRKTVHGPLTLQRIGLGRVRAECPHFDAWLRRLEQLAA